jgi:hexokinase
MELSNLCLKEAQLLEVRAYVRDAVRRGLEADDQQVAALCAHLPPPRSVEGEALAVDVGGTNVRAARVAVDGRGGRLVEGPVKAPLREGGHLPEKASSFFAVQADLVTSLQWIKDAPVGYVFSYPARVQPDRDAVLLGWTKGIDIPEMIGTRVGTGLDRALRERGVQAGPVTVLNDTVATLLGGAVAFESPPQRLVGLIVGTGTNMAAFFSPEVAPKLSDPSAVNLESGNLAPPHLSELDEQVDAASTNPGQQRFEKATSGKYLPLLYGAITGEPAPGSAAHLVRTAAKSAAGALPKGAAPPANPVGGAPAQVARLLLDRSADLVASALAGVLDLLPPGASGVVAEGALFWGDPGYAPRVRAWLDRWAPERTVRLFRQENVNLFGAAVAARTS